MGLRANIVLLQQLYRRRGGSFHVSKPIQLGASSYFPVQHHSSQDIQFFHSIYLQWKNLNQHFPVDKLNHIFQKHGHGPYSTDEAGAAHLDND